MVEGFLFPSATGQTNAHGHNLDFTSSSRTWARLPDAQAEHNCLSGPTFSFQMIFMTERRPQSMKKAPGVLMLLLGTLHRKTQHDVLFNAGATAQMLNILHHGEIKKEKMRASDGSCLSSFCFPLLHQQPAASSCAPHHSSSADDSRHEPPSRCRWRCAVADWR
jgi:hypothetical protein